MSHSVGLNYHSHECVLPSITLAHPSLHMLHVPLTWRQSSTGLTHAGGPKAQTLLLEPGPPLLLQLLLDLVDFLR